MGALDEAVTYPMEDDEWLKTVLIGGLLMAFSFLLVPLFLVYGYVVRTIVASLDGQPEPPAFDDWGDLLVDGLLAWIIGLVYMLVPLAVGAITVGGSLVAIATGTEAGLAAGLSGLLFGFLVTFVLALLFGYVAVAAVVNFAREGRFGAGFDLAVIREVAFHRDYAVAWLLAVAVFVATGIVTSMVNVIPIVGFFLGAFVTFYATVVAANLWAGGFASALGTTDEVRSAGGEEPVV